MASSRSLEQTPSWAVALVFFSIISFSILLEHFIHLLSNWLKKRRNNSLNEALEKLKSELMVLGFISLLLAVAQRSISKICITTHVADTMLPCRKQTETGKGSVSGGTHRKLSGDTANTDHCNSKGMVSLISVNGIHHLHIFIFMLAVMHVVYSVLTMALGRAKTLRWKAWEKETQTTEYQASTDPGRFRFIKQTTFGRRHIKNSSMTTSLYLWIHSFFRQFFNSVAKVDYLTLRHGFISTHLPTNGVFDFHKYIERSLEDDFKVVVGISPIMWFVVAILLLVNVHGWNIYFWLSFLPLIIILAVGTNLQLIVTRMALQLQEQSNVVKGALQVQPSDDHFLFGRPKLVLVLLHFTLFQNAFELTFFIWIWIEYGLTSCYHDKFVIIIIRVVLALGVQLLCSYVTLPLYALVTQMGSQFKRAIFDEEIANAVRRWHIDVREKRKKQQSLHDLSSRENTRLTIGLSSPIRQQLVAEKTGIPEGEITLEQEII